MGGEKRLKTCLELFWTTGTLPPGKCSLVRPTSPPAGAHPWQETKEPSPQPAMSSPCDNGSKETGYTGAGPKILPSSEPSATICKTPIVPNSVPLSTPPAPIVSTFGDAANDGRALPLEMAQLSQAMCQHHVQTLTTDSGVVNSISPLVIHSMTSPAVVSSQSGEISQPFDTSEFAKLFNRGQTGRN